MGDIQAPRVREPSGGLDAERLIEDFPFGLVAFNEQRVAIADNAAARGLFADADLLGENCCRLLCSLIDPDVFTGCLLDDAAAKDEGSAELLVDLQSGCSAWIAAYPIDPGTGASALIQLRGAMPGERRRRGEHARPKEPLLRIHALGRTRVESSEAVVPTEWLDQRPAQLLKFLLCHRNRTAQVDEIAEALSPEGGGGSEQSVRFLVHSLRTALEPGRDRRAESAFVTARKGGYALNRSRIWVDAESFEGLVAEGMSSLLDGDPQLARDRLGAAMKLYGGDFLDEERYAEWAIEERERLRELAARALGALVEICVAESELEYAFEFARKLADLEPYDSQGQRRMLEICLLRGRRSEAMRRYATFRRRMTRDLGTEPEFELNELMAGSDPAEGNG